jgi:hypothetical protein
MKWTHPSSSAPTRTNSKLDVALDIRIPTVAEEPVLQAHKPDAEHAPAVATHLTLCVDLDNPRAKSLYERLGFADSGVGVFTTSGVFVDDEGNDTPWQIGPQFLLVQEL